MNRNPQRIPEVLDLIQEIWKKNPDLRLTQIIQSVVEEGEDYFYLEDEDLYLRLCLRYEV